MVDTSTATEITYLRQQVETLTRERDSAEIGLRDHITIVSRIWSMLGTPTYEQLAGRSIYDMIAEVQASAAEASRLREALDHPLASPRTAIIDECIAPRVSTRSAKARRRVVPHQRQTDGQDC